ncbi:aminotransferase-like domain-containing protein [Robbsia andropogonis]|uniref:aminotransferase-like domain-containing protein n=1 Tax=Robbsia andropogonis TaxID=28092 RepID=UPI002A6AE6FE|nr:PLP-dependent aminotransferase family protein [Robbsia andropogonis]
MKIALDAGSDLSMSEQIVRQIETLIAEGRLHAGEKLWSIRQLAVDQKISRFPILEAYDKLANRGLIYSRPGSGYFVAESIDLERAAGGENRSLAQSGVGQLCDQCAQSEQLINLSVGSIPETWRDVEGIAQAVRHAVKNDSRSLIDYASPQGEPRLRLQVQQRLRRFELGVDPQCIMLTDSASEALDLIVRLVLNPGDTVFVEDPGYFNLFGLLKIQGVELIGVPRLPNGPDILAVENFLQTASPKAFFVNSALHNPTGSNVSPDVGFRLLQLAHEHGFLIIEDDVFAEFQAVPSVRLAALDRLRQVIYVSGFSKSLSSSLRLGYIVAAPEKIKHLVDLRAITRLGGSRFSEHVTAALLEHGTYGKHLDRLRRKANSALSIALGHLRDAGWQVFGEPCGGMFIWASVPGIADSAHLVDKAAELGIALEAGRHHRPNNEATPWLRLNTGCMNDARAIEFLYSITKT